MIYNQQHHNSLKCLVRGSNSLSAAGPKHPKTNISFYSSAVYCCCLYAVTFSSPFFYFFQTFISIYPFFSFFSSVFSLEFYMNSLFFSYSDFIVNFPYPSFLTILSSFLCFLGICFGGLGGTSELARALSGRKFMLVAFAFQRTRRRSCSDCALTTIFFWLPSVQLMSAYSANQLVLLAFSTC